MLCYSPLIKINKSQTSLLSINGKEFVSYKWFKNKDQLNNLVRSGAIQLLSCGNCFNCINMRRYHWVKKLSLEKKQWKNTYFITLTYNDHNYPDELRVDHIQNFIKYLRKFIKKLKYFCSGEYGSKTARAHYHLILFTDYDLELDFIKQTKSGPLFKCDLLDKCWLNRGFIWVGYDLDNMSFAYVSSYSNKNYLKKTINKQLKEFNNKLQIIKDSNISGFHKYLQIEKLLPLAKFKKPEFIIMSKKPPIGSKNLKDLKEAPSSLIKWFLKKYDYSNLNDVNLSVHLNNSYFVELKNRQEDFIKFLKSNNISDIINYERLFHLKKEKEKEKGFL